MIDRYEIEDFEEHSDCVFDGEFVRYSDYAELRAMCNELAKALNTIVPDEDDGDYYWSSNSRIKRPVIAKYRAMSENNTKGGE